MTNTASSRKTAELALAAPQMLSRDAGESLVDQIVRSIESRIDDKLLRSGARMPSIRQFAEQHRVSRFTVVEAYDRLVAKGYLESRRGSGFYVRERSPLVSAAAGAWTEQPPAHLDVVWLVRNMFRQQLPPQKTPGSGMLPSDWLDGELIANGLRAISRQSPAMLIQYGNPQGFLPLRQQLQLKLAELEIGATPEQIVTTTGITQGLDLVARHFTVPGDTIFVDDPAWFLMFGSFATLGAKVVGIPRLPDGPDIARLAELAAVARDQADARDVGIADPGFLGHHRDVAEQRVGCGKADGVTIDGGNDRLVQLELTRDGAAADHGIMHLALLEHVAAGPLRHRLHIAADAEIVARAGQHDYVDGMVIAEIIPDRPELADQLLIDGVAGLRPVQCHRRHLVCDVDFQALILGVSRHFILPFCSFG